MNKSTKLKLDELKNNQCTEAMDLLNTVRQELELLGRKRDVARFTKIVDLIDEWHREE